jgi:hypothetical protein
MATNEAILAHLATVQQAVNAALNNVHRYQGYNSEMLSAAKASLLATVTTVPSALQHASNCSICNAWDGSVEGA